MSLLGTLGSVGKILGGLGGLFGSKGHDAGGNSYLAIGGQAQGARDHGKKFGFNPLTLLGRSAPMGPSLGGGGAPPLASVEMLLGGIQDIGESLAKPSAQKDAVDRFRRDMAGLNLDQTRSGVVLDVPRYARQSFSTPSPLGGNSVTVTQSTGGPIGPSFERGGRGLPPSPPPGGNDVAAKNASVDAALGDVPVPDANLDRGSPWFLGGNVLEAPTGWTSPAVFEDEVAGDNALLTWPYSLLWSGAAVAHNAARLSGSELKSPRGEIDYFLADQKRKPRVRGNAPRFPRFNPNHRDGYYYP